jgi:CheY-like chemotaxis protein
MPDSFKIIVIDDDQGACLFLKKILEKAGPFSVITTTDSKAAVHLCVQEKPDFIIVDNVMPEVKGAHLVQSLRGKSLTKKIPILMLTGKGEMVFEQKKEKFEWRPNSPIVKQRGELEEQKNPPSLPNAYGVDYYMAKPVNTIKLLEIANHLLAIKRKKEGFIGEVEEAN